MASPRLRFSCTAAAAKGDAPLVVNFSIQGRDPVSSELADQLRDMPRYAPRDGTDDHDGPVAEGSYNEFPLFETNADAVFCALQGRRLPAKRHPFGIQMRIEELNGDHVIDEGGDLWHRRIEEIDAAACALAAHRYAVGHASWLGEPDEAVVVLPGSSIPAEFETRGVLPPVERLQLLPQVGATGRANSEREDQHDRQHEQ